MTIKEVSEKNLNSRRHDVNVCDRLIRIRRDGGLGNVGDIHTISKITPDGKIYSYEREGGYRFFYSEYCFRKFY
jgi:hypothetical protein